MSTQVNPHNKYAAASVGMMMTYLAHVWVDRRWNSESDHEYRFRTPHDAHSFMVDVLQLRDDLQARAIIGASIDGHYVTVTFARADA